MCYWKQWRYARTKVRKLLKLGTDRKAAIFVAISRKGPVASGPDSGHSDRYDQPVAQGKGSRVCQRAVGEYPLPDYGPVGSVNRPVRTRMQGGVGRGSSKLPFTRLGLSSSLILLFIFRQLCNFEVKRNAVFCFS